MQEMSDDQWTALLGGSAALHGLAIEPEWYPAVLVNLKVVAQAAKLVSDHPVDDGDEAAPVFTA